MMVAERERSQELIRNIFGQYIYQMRTIPGREQEAKEREYEKKLFQIIDDYVEQA